MRLFILLFMLVTVGFSCDSISYFTKSPDNELLCHLGQYSFKIVSQKNSAIVDIHGHKFFKLKDENLYFLNNTCEPIEDGKKAIVF